MERTNSVVLPDAVKVLSRDGEVCIHIFLGIYLVLCLFGNSGYLVLVLFGEQCVTWVVPLGNYWVITLYYTLAEVPSLAWVLNGLPVDAVYPILLLYSPETPVPSLSCRNLLLGSLLCPPGMLILVGFNM